VSHVTGRVNRIILNRDSSQLVYILEIRVRDGFSPSDLFCRISRFFANRDGHFCQFPKLWPMASRFMCCWLNFCSGGNFCNPRPLPWSLLCYNYVYSALSKIVPECTAANGRKHNKVKTNLLICMITCSNTLLQRLNQVRTCFSCLGSNPKNDRNRYRKVLPDFEPSPSAWRVNNRNNVF